MLTISTSALSIPSLPFTHSFSSTRTVPTCPSSLDERIGGVFWDAQKLTTFANAAIKVCRDIEIKNFSEHLRAGEVNEAYLQLYYELTQVKVDPKYLPSFCLAKVWEEKILPHLYYVGMKVPIMRIDKYYELGNHPQRNWPHAVMAITKEFPTLSVAEICKTWKTVRKFKQEDPNCFKGCSIIYIQPDPNVCGLNETKSISATLTLSSRTSASVVSDNDRSPPLVPANTQSIESYHHTFPPHVGAFSREIDMPPLYPGLCYTSFGLGVNMREHDQQSYLIPSSSSSSSSTSTTTTSEAVTPTNYTPSMSTTSQTETTNTPITPTTLKVLSSTRMLSSQPPPINLTINSNWTIEEEEDLLRQYVIYQEQLKAKNEHLNTSLFIRTYLKRSERQKFSKRSLGSIESRLRALKERMGSTDNFEFDLTGSRRKNFSQQRKCNNRRKWTDFDENEEWLDDSPHKKSAAESASSKPTVQTKWTLQEEDHLCEKMNDELIDQNPTYQKAYMAYQRILKSQNVLPYRTLNAIEAKTIALRKVQKIKSK